VAVHGTVTAAAAALHVTASALSQQLAKLEREIGQPLLVHRGRGVALTDAGHLLARHTEAILAAITRAETDLQAQRGQVAGRMAIGAFATATRALLPAALRRLRDEHPGLRVESRESEPADALMLLDRGEIDLAVIDEWFDAEPALPEALCWQPLCDDVADLALPAAHPLAAADRVVELHWCADQTWITWGPGAFGHEWLLRALHQHRTHPAIAYTANEHQTLLALVSAGLGIALMPRLGRGPVPPGVAIRPLRPTVTRRIFAVWRTDTSARPAIQAATQTLQLTAVEQRQ
jgi:DNA-binding transcriptional LysR family regulator